MFEGSFRDEHLLNTEHALCEGRAPHGAYWMLKMVGLSLHAGRAALSLLRDLSARFVGQQEEIDAANKSTSSKMVEIAKLRGGGLGEMPLGGAYR